MDRWAGGPASGLETCDGHLDCNGPGTGDDLAQGPGPGPSALMRQPGLWSGGPRRWQGQVQGLVEVERHAGGVSLLESLLAERGTDLVEAVQAVASFGLLPRFSG